MGNLYLVLGGVSSGCRLVTRLLIAAGVEGDGNHIQRFDTNIPEGYQNIVWRRSYPHGKPGSSDRWPDALAMIEKAEQSGYQLKHIIVTHRDWNAASHSAARRRASIPSVSKAIEFNRRAFLMIYQSLNDLKSSRDFNDYTMCSYDQLVAFPSLYSNWLIKHLGLKWERESEEIFNSNLKFYKGLKNDNKGIL